MYLQAYATRVLSFACVKTQAAQGLNRHRLIVLVPAMIVAGMFAAAPIGGQTVAQTSSVERLTSIDPAYINQEGSLPYSEVNLGSSSLSPVVNQFDSSSALPEAPSAGIQGQSLRASTPPITRTTHSGTEQLAPIYWKEIPAGWAAQPLTAHDKIVLGARSLYSPFSFLGYIVSASYSHVENGQPNYGTNATAYGKRLGAVTLRDVSEGIFADIVFAPMLHEDPRYYVEGSQHGFFRRVAYAITRPLVTRTDSGRVTLNGAGLLGSASASALSYTYYPAINQNFHDTVATFGGSLAGSALGDVVKEFAGQFLEAIHLKKVQ